MDIFFRWARTMGEACARTPTDWEGFYRNELEKVPSKKMSIFGRSDDEVPEGERSIESARLGRSIERTNERVERT